ncbi:MAG: PRC-barrel domain-containing protein [Coriobacteriales bacterium]|nr:PRC-barrel domain-containing protein [Actinomycetes bacterium]
MPRVSRVIGREVVSSRGQVLGRVSEVLFAASEPVAIGLAVERPRVAGVVGVAPRYIPLTSVSFDEGKVLLDAAKAPSLAASEKTIGMAWDATVQWRGMPVVGSDGERVGTIVDIEFERPGGRVLSLVLSSGMIADAAIGRMTVPGQVITGYRDDAVRITTTYGELTASGGAAKSLAAGVAVAKEHGGKVAKQAYDTGMSAAISVGRSFKRGKAKRAVDGLRKIVSDAMKDDDE